MKSIRKKGYCLLVEGESDTQALWFMGLPALGVPGASTFKEAYVDKLKGLKLYVHKEPDHGGETFTSSCYETLGKAEFEVFEWKCSDAGEKDPSDILIRHGKDDGLKIIDGLLKKAKYVKFDTYPIRLNQAPGFYFNDSGIYEAAGKDNEPKLICRTPILLTRRLKNLDSGEERIEIAFQRDEKWQTAIFPRSTIFTARKITELADMGCTVASENARSVVRFLTALEAQNMNAIPKYDAISRFGWHKGKRFYPGFASDCALDIDPSQRSMAAAYHSSGTLDEWLAIMQPFREIDSFRCILAASFAAPCLYWVRQRSFFIYNWGNARGGKTAALKAALSVWGEPEELMVNFNATQVGLERTAAFYCDLPLGIDERQLGGRQDNLEKIVYMIASGSGRLRGAKTGGIQTLQQWRTIAIATGEEPITTDTSKQGVGTRVLEIYQGPFQNEKDAARMHQQTAMHFGTAGPAFIRRLLDTGEERIQKRFELMLNHLSNTAENSNGAHIACMAVAAMADSFVSEWLYGDQNGVKRALEMGVHLLRTIEKNATDVNVNATNAIRDWIEENRRHFDKDNNIVDHYGYMEDDFVYIIPTCLNEMLKKLEFNPKKTMQYLADTGQIETETGHLTVRKYFGGARARFIQMRIEGFEEFDDPDRPF